MEAVGVKSELGVVPNTENVFQCQECILFGTVYKDHKDELLCRLAGLCDPGQGKFSEHEMMFTLRVGAGRSATSAPPVEGVSQDVISVRLRRKFGNANKMEEHQWHVRYVSPPQPDPTTPAIVRRTVHSIVRSPDMMTFLKDLGFRMDFEYMANGVTFTCGKIKVIVQQLTRTDQIGNYEAAHIKQVSENSWFVEASVSLPAGVDYKPAVRSLIDFTDQLRPLVNMQRVDYWKKM